MCLCGTTVTSSKQFCQACLGIKLFFLFFFLRRVTEIRASFQMSKESLCSSTDACGKESPERTLDKSCALLTRN